MTGGGKALNSLQKATKHKINRRLRTGFRVRTINRAHPTTTTDHSYPTCQTPLMVAESIYLCNAVGILVGFPIIDFKTSKKFPYLYNMLQDVRTCN